MKVVLALQWLASPYVIHVVQDASNSQGLEGWKSKALIQRLTAAKFKAHANLRDFFLTSHLSAGLARNATMGGHPSLLSTSARKTFCRILNLIIMIELIFNNHESYDLTGLAHQKTHCFVCKGLTVHFLPIYLS